MDRNFSFVRSPCGILQRLRDVLILQKRIPGQDLFTAMLGGDQTYQDVHRDAQTSDARAPAHDLRIHRDALQRLHASKVNDYREALSSPHDPPSTLHHVRKDLGFGFHVAKGKGNRGRARKDATVALEETEHMDRNSSRIVVATLTLASSVTWSGSNAQSVDLSVHGFRSDVTVPISDLTKRSLEYHRLYLYQATDMDFSAAVTNLGPDTAEAIQVRLEIFRYGTSQGEFFSDTLQSLAPGGIDTMAINADWYGQVGGEIELAFEVLSSVPDIDPENNLDTAAMDISGWWTQRAPDVWNDTLMLPFDTRIAVRYEFVSSDYAFGMRFTVPEQPGLEEAIVEVELRDQDMSILTSQEVWLAGSGSEPGEFDPVFLWFPDVVEIEAGHDYYATIHSFAPQLALAANGECADSSVFLIGASNEILAVAEKLPLVGIVQATSYIPEHASAVLSLGSCAPDPADRSTTIHYSITAPGSPMVVIASIDGLIVRSIGLGRSAPGSHVVDLDVTELTTGVYLCSVLMDGQRAAVRLTVVH